MRSRSNEDLLRFRRDNLQFRSKDGEAPPAILWMCCGGSTGDGRNFADEDKSFALGGSIILST